VQDLAGHAVAIAGRTAALEVGSFRADDLRKLQDEIQDLIKQYEGKIDEELERKTEEIMTI